MKPGDCASSDAGCSLPAFVAIFGYSWSRKLTYTNDQRCLKKVNDKRWHSRRHLWKCLLMPVFTPEAPSVYFPVSVPRQTLPPHHCVSTERAGRVHIWTPSRKWKTSSSELVLSLCPKAFPTQIWQVLHALSAGLCWAFVWGEYCLESSTQVCLGNALASACSLCQALYCPSRSQFVVAQRGPSVVVVVVVCVF